MNILSLKPLLKNFVNPGDFCVISSSNFDATTFINSTLNEYLIYCEYEEAIVLINATLVPDGVILDKFINLNLSDTITSGILENSSKKIKYILAYDLHRDTSLLTTELIRLATKCDYSLIMVVNNLENDFIIDDLLRKASNYFKVIGIKSDAFKIEWVSSKDDKANETIYLVKEFY